MKYWYRCITKLKIVRSAQHRVPLNTIAHTPGGSEAHATTRGEAKPSRKANAYRTGTAPHTHTHTRRGHTHAFPSTPSVSPLGPSQSHHRDCTRSTQRLPDTTLPPRASVQSPLPRHAVHRCPPAHRLPAQGQFMRPACNHTLHEQSPSYTARDQAIATSQPRRQEGSVDVGCGTELTQGAGLAFPRAPRR